MISRRDLLSLAAMAPFASAASAATDWPRRPIRIILPSAAGGTSDILARHIAEPLGQLLGQPIVIEAKAGAGGAIASQYVAQQPADGYTLLTHHNGFVTTPLMRSSAGYKLSDFTAVSMQGTAPLILVTHPSMPATLDAFIAHARANPGKLEWATASLGGIGHLAVELFNDAAGIKDMVQVAFPGNAPATQALLAGHVKYMMTTPAASTAALVRDGRLRVLGVSSSARSSMLPEIPAIAETLPGYEADVWFGLVARAGTPEPVLKKLNEAFTTVLSRPEIVAKYGGANVTAQGGSKAMADVLQRDHAMWSRVIKEKNLRLD